MRLLHLSDIHFNSPRCNSELDPDLPFRTELINDLRDRVQESGPIDAILITGDIAYKGHPEEFDFAKSWLTELADVGDCPLSRIFIVPGNHDVDRATISASKMIQNVQDSIINVQNARDRERALYDNLRDPDASSFLFKPLSAYNEFAASYSCQVYGPERLYWDATLDLDDKTKLRIYGLTSVLTSGGRARDDAPGSMYLSPMQTVLNPKPGVINLIMSHHPPAWLIDKDEVEHEITNRAHIQLFGHEHNQRVMAHQQYIRFAAGATNPDRYEQNWKPGYNIISLSVEYENPTSYILIAADMREWQTAPSRFRAIEHHDGSMAFSCKVPFRANFTETVRDGVVENNGTSAAHVSTESVSVNKGERMDADKTRDLVRRFFALTASQRREIVYGLDLLEDQEISLPEPQRYDRALRRASERRLLGKLAERVDRLEKL